MARETIYMGQHFSFPDDASDEEVNAFLSEDWEARKPTMASTIAGIPAAAGRELRKEWQGAQIIAKDIFGGDITENLATLRELEQEAARAQLGMTLGQEIVQAGGTSALTNLPGLVGGGLATAARFGTRRAAGAAAEAAAEAALKAGVSAGTTIAGTQTGLGTYGLSREAGLSPLRSTFHALADAVTEKYTEMYPAAWLSRAGGKGLWEAVKGFAKQEVLGEEIATTLQDLNAKLSYNPDLTWGDYVRDLIVTAGAVGIAGPLQAGAIRGATALLPTVPGAEVTPPGPPPAQPLPPAAPPAATPTPAPTPSVRDLLSRNRPMPVEETPTVREAVETLPEVPGMRRLYFVQPAGMQDLPEQVIATTSRQEAETAVQTLGGRAQIRTADVAPEQLQQMHEQLTQLHDDLQRQITTPGMQFAVDRGVFVSARPQIVSTPETLEAGTVTQTPSPTVSTQPPVDIVPQPPVVSGPDGTPAPTRLRIRIGKQDKTVEVAPEVKAIYQLGSSLNRFRRAGAGAKDYDAIQALAQPLMQRFGLTYPELREFATVVRDRITAEAKGVATGATLNLPPAEQWARDFKRLPETIRPEDAGRVSTGQRFQQQLAGLESTAQLEVQRMVKTFEGWMKVFTPRASVRVRELSTIKFPGALSRIADGSYELVLPSPGINTLQRLSSLAHEMGHLIIYEHFSAPDNTALTAKVRQEYDALLREVPNMTARQFLERWGSPIRASRANAILRNLGLPPDAPAQAYVDAVNRAWAAGYIDKYGQEAYERAVELYGPQGYMLSFPEYGAEQASRYLNARGRAAMPKEYHGYWDALVGALKDFYQRVVSKLRAEPNFEAFLDSFTTQGKLDAVAPEKTPGPPTVDFTSISDPWDELTTKVLERLPQKPVLKKVTIDGELRRSDVREQERAVIKSVLARMPGEAVDRERFVEEVMKELVPVQYGHSQSRYADYGAARVLPTVEYGSLDIPDVASNVYTSPIIVGPDSNHFGHPNYIGHTRTWDMPDRSVFGEKARIVAEVQSDVLQGVEQIQEVDRLDQQVALAERDYANALAAAPSLNAAVGYHRIQRAELHLREAQAALERARAGNRFKNAPKRWWELLLRLEMKRAAANGRKTLVVPSAETLARIEGWHRGTLQDEAGMEYPMSPEQEAATPYGEEVQPIYARYLRDIPRFLKREWGATELLIPGVAGLELGGEFPSPTTWWSMPVRPDLQDLPVEYFDINTALVDAADDAGRVSGNPEIPKAFERMRSLALYNLQLNQLVRILPNVPGVKEFRDAMRGLTNLKNRLMVGPNERLKEWFKLKAAQSQLVSSALRAEVNSGEHWTELKQEADGTWVHEASPRFLEEMKSRGLSEDAAKVVLGVKNDFLTMLGVMENTLTRSIERYFRANPVAAATRIAEVQKEFQLFREKPYLPDRGFGQWDVKIHAKQDYEVEGRTIKKGELIYWEKFETERARDKKYKELKSQYGQEFTVSAGKVEETPFVLRGLPTEFVSRMIETLQLSPEQVAALQQLQYDATREGAYFKLLGKGKKFIGGASEDIRRVYSDYMWRTSNFVAKMYYSQDVADAKNATAQHGQAIRKAGGDSSTINDIHQHLNRLTDYVMKPQHEWEQLRALVSLWYLWAVPRTAMMNFMSVPVTGYSHLAAQYGDAGALTGLMRAMKDVGLALRHPDRLQGEDAQALDRAAADGVTDQSYAAEMAAVADGPAMERLLPHYSGWLRDSGVSDATQKALWHTVHVGMWPFRAMEQFNRRVMVLSTFRLARAQGKTFEEAYQLARDATDYTQNDYSPWNRPRLLQGKKSAALIFFSFIQNMAFFMYGGDRGWWRALIILAALAGLQALPGIENLMDILSWAWTKFSGERTDLKEEAQKVATALGANPDAVMHGIPRLVLPGDISASMSMGRIVPGTDFLTTYSDDAAGMLNALAEVGGPFGSLAVSGAKALVDSNPNTLLRFERVMPTALRNVRRAVEMARTGEITNTRGTALAENATPAEIVGQALGFTPTRKAQAQEAMFEKRNAAEYYIHRRTNLLSALYVARHHARDADMEKDVRDAIHRYNASAPYPQLRITGKDIAESMKRRRDNERLMEQGRPREKRFQRLYREMEEVYDTP